MSKAIEDQFGQDRVKVWKEQLRQLIIQCWKDEDFKAAFKKDPKGTAEQFFELDSSLADLIQFQVIDLAENPPSFPVVQTIIPPKPEGMNDEELEKMDLGKFEDVYNEAPLSVDQWVDRVSRNRHMSESRSSEMSTSSIESSTENPFDRW